MDLKNCKICGKVTNNTIRGLCKECFDEREQAFLVVRDFIKDNPKVAIEVVMEATGVDERTIREFIRAGLIQAADLNGFPLECIRCGKPISRGVYCPICRQNFESETSAQTDPFQEKDKKKKNRKPRSLVLQLRKRK